MHPTPIKIVSVLLLNILIALTGCSRHSGEAQTFQTAQPSPQHGLVGAYYYPWYWESRWTEQPVTDTPVLGFYRSDDRSVIRRHIEWARQAGIDFFIISWLNKEGPENANLKKAILPELEKANFPFILLYETRLALNWSYDKPVDFEKMLPNATKAGHTMVEQIEYLADTYFNSKSYLRLNERPVIILYALGYMSNGRQYFDALKKRMKKRGVELHMIADVVYWDPLEKNDWTLIKDNFRAVTAYNMWYRSNFLNAVSNRFVLSDLIARENGLRFIPNVMPGYDDTHLRGLGRPIFERADTKFFRAYWGMASTLVDTEQPFLFLTSFNEWHEGSEIEPSVEYGDNYLLTTRELTESLHLRFTRTTNSTRASANAKASAP